MMNSTIMAASFLEKTWKVFETYQGMFFGAIKFTLIVAIVGTIAGLLLGLVIGGLRAICGSSEQGDKAMMKMLKKIVFFLTSAYVEVFRGTPMMVQAMFLQYTFFVPVLGWEPITSAMVIISVNTGAYMAEIVRAGIQAVDKGQIEGARSIGMNAFQTMMSIVLPQAIRNSFPSIGNEFVINIKDSCVLNAIQFSELFFVAKSVAGTTFSYAEPFFIVGIIYFVLTFATSRILGVIEARMNNRKSVVAAQVE